MPPPENRPSSPWPAFACVALGVFMATLDSSIVTVALPSILADFDAPLAVVEWVPNAYLLVITGLLLSFGRLADIHGHKGVYLTGLGVFTTGSALCAFSSGPGGLIAARVVQGMGAAMVMACAPAIITAVFPPEKRGKGLGLVGTTVAIGLTSGPSLGGVLLELGGWRSLFLVNLPVGLAALGLTAKLLPRLRFTRGHQGFDLPGAVWLTVGCTAWLLAVNRARDWGLALPTLAAAALGTMALVAFLRREGRVADPLLDLSLFRNRSFSAAVAAAVLSYLSGFVAILLLPFYLTQVRGMTPGQMGLTLTIPPLMMSLFAPWAGALSDRVGYGRLTAAGLTVRTIALGGLWTLGPTTPLVWVVGVLALLGMGSAVFNPPNTSSIMGSVPPHQLGVAGSIAAVARNLGMVLGIAGGGATFAVAFRRAGGTTLGAYTPDLAGAFTTGWRAAMTLGFVACVVGLVASLTRAPGVAHGADVPDPADEVDDSSRGR